MFDLVIKFLWKNNFLGCLLGSGLIFLDHYLNFFADKVISWTIGKREVSSANSLGFKTKLPESLLINIKKKGGPRINP